MSEYRNKPSGALWKNSGTAFQRLNSEKILRRIKRNGHHKKEKMFRRRGSRVTLPYSILCQYHDRKED